MKESTERPAWTQTLFQGMGNGLNAFKHKVEHMNRDGAVIIRDYLWTADADSVKREPK